MSDTSTSDDTYSAELTDAASSIAKWCDLSEAEAAAELQEFRDYGVDLRRAAETLADDYDVPEPAVQACQSASVDDIDTPKQGYNLTVKFVEEWDTNKDISQSGIIGDESGTIKFARFPSADGVPSLVEGECYAIEDAWGSTHDGGVEVIFNSRTEVAHLPDTSIDVAESGEEYTGTIVKMKRGSGLISRCDHEDCSRTLSNGQCSEHGPQEGTHDLRIKATIDDGSDPNPPTAIFDADMVAELTGISLEDAIELSATNVDSGVVADKLRSQIIGQRLTVTGGVYENDRSDTMVVNEVSNDSGLDAAAVDDALVEARNMVSGD